MSLPVLAVGATAVVEERWRGQLWAAVPHRVITSTAEELVTWVPTWTIATRASARGLPEVEGLDREQRKQFALRTGRARVIETREAPDKLVVHRADRWASVNLGFDPRTGAFLGWYVNLQLPPSPTPQGIATMDLVLDLWVEPDRTWSWKDRESYAVAVETGLIEPEQTDRIGRETDRVIAEVEGATGPFADRWPSYRPDPDLPLPELPRELAWGGSDWSLPTGRRVPPPS